MIINTQNDANKKQLNTELEDLNLIVGMKEQIKKILRKNQTENILQFQKIKEFIEEMDGEVKKIEEKAISESLNLIARAAIPEDMYEKEYLNFYINVDQGINYVIVKNAKTERVEDLLIQLSSEFDFSIDSFKTEDTIKEIHSDQENIVQLF